MAEDPNAPPNNARSQRRSSFAGQTFADLFGTGSRSAIPRQDGSNSPPQQQGPIASAAAQANRRRLSLTTLGLSGSPDTGNRLGPFRHRDSVGSINSSTLDESAVEDDAAPPMKDGSTPATPFARRMSFGARALRDVRGSTSGGSTGTSPGQNGIRSPPASSVQPSHNRAPSGTISSRDAKGRGEGFNWSENLRTRAERTSIAAQGGGGGTMPLPSPPNHDRAKSVATMEQSQPRAIPNPQQRPDHFQERILKGDFYMD